MRITYLHLVSACLVGFFVCVLLPNMTLAEPQESAPQWTLKIKNAGKNQKIFATLRNVGNGAQWAIQVNDGSESGWREPTVTWDVQVLKKNKWVPASMKPMGRCGLYATDWQKDAVRIESGQSLELAMDWAGHPSAGFKVTEAQRYRARLHYSYSGGRLSKGGNPSSSQQSSSYGPNYEVLSDWIEL